MHRDSRISAVTAFGLSTRLSNHGATDIRVVNCASHPTQWTRSTYDRAMSSDEITAYLNGLDEPRRTTLQQLRRTILEVVPEAQEGISYAVPAFRLHDKVIAGFAAFKTHLSYLPHSGSVFPELVEELSPYTKTKGALHFAIDEPLPKAIVEKLIKVRISQAFHE